MNAWTESTESFESAPAIEVHELRRLQLFRGVDVSRIAPLLNDCELRELAPGETLIAVGRPNDKLYLLLDGRLSVRLGVPDSDPLAFIERGDSVGELSLIDHQPASASVIAELPCRVLVIDEELLWILSNSSHAMSGNLLFTLVRRMRAGNAMIFESRSRLEQYRFHATVDGLTGLFNRHWLNQMLPRQMHRARSSSEPLSILMVDIDWFKRYNDLHGHPAGDQALCAVAACLRDNVRPADMVARYGGEEMLAILPACPLSGAKTVAERLRSAVEATRVVRLDGRQLPAVTASIGAAELRPEMSMNDFISHCDKALYRAKGAGRNCVRH